MALITYYSMNYPNGYNPASYTSLIDSRIDSETL